MNSTAGDRRNHHSSTPYFSTAWPVQTSVDQPTARCSWKGHGYSSHIVLPNTWGTSPLDTPGSFWVCPDQLLGTPGTSNYQELQPAASPETQASRCPRSSPTHSSGEPHQQCQHLELNVKGLPSRDCGARERYHLPGEQQDPQHYGNCTEEPGLCPWNPSMTSHDVTLMEGSLYPQRPQHSLVSHYEL